MVFHRNLGREISICGKGWPLVSEDMTWAGKENKGLLKVDQELSEWIHGPFIAMGHNGSILLNGPDSKAAVPWQEQVYDLEPIDFRHVVDRMRGEHYRSGREFRVYEEGSQEKVKGVRMNCTGDVLTCMRKMTESVDVAKSMCTEESDVYSSIVEKVGIPLVVRKIPHAMCWRGRREGGLPYPTNPGPLILDLQKQYDKVREQLIHTEFPSWEPLGSKEPLGGVASDVGSCVAGRRDGEALDVKFVEALQVYGRYKLGDATKATRAAGKSRGQHLSYRLERGLGGLLHGLLA
jgi:hypothetical protein